MSSVASSSRRPSGPRRAVLVLAAVVALGACSHNREIPERYGDSTRDNFVEGCEEALTDPEGEGERLDGDEATAVCTCTYEGISDAEDGIPFEQLQEINDEQEEDPGPLPEAFRDAVEACRGEAGLS